MSAGRKNTSDKKDYNTPPKYVELIEKFFNNEIGLDPCSNVNSMINSKTKFLLPTNGLEMKWNYKNIFVNPHYGRDVVNKTSIYNWISKGCEAFKNGSELLYLIPVATNTKHFKLIIFNDSCGICFLADTRLKFWSDGYEYKKGSLMSCCVVYFGKDYNRFKEVFKNVGKCFEI